MEQTFKNHLRTLRCRWKIDVKRVGPAHGSIARATIEVGREDMQPIIGHGSAPKSKDAIRMAMRNLWERVLAIPDPCTTTRPFAHISVPQPVVVFKPPHVGWFETAQVLGVDWEGQPPAIVQIACASGVYIDKADAPTARSILDDRRHTHCVFGEKRCIHPHSDELERGPTECRSDPIRCAGCGSHAENRFETSFAGVTHQFTLPFCSTL